MFRVIHGLTVAWQQSGGWLQSPRLVGVIGPPPRPVDVFDDEVDVSASQDEQGHGVTLEEGILLPTAPRTPGNRLQLARGGRLFQETRRPGRLGGQRPGRRLRMGYRLVPRDGSDGLLAHARSGITPNRRELTSTALRHLSPECAGRSLVSDRARRPGSMSDARPGRRASVGGAAVPSAGTVQVPESAGHPCPRVCAPGAHSAFVRRFHRLPVAAFVDASG